MHKEQPPDDSGRALAVPPAEAGRLLSLSIGMIYNLMSRGELRSVTIGRSRRVPMSEIERLLGGGDAGAA